MSSKYEGHPSPVEGNIAATSLHTSKLKTPLLSEGRFIATELNN